MGLISRVSSRTYRNQSREPKFVNSLVLKSTPATVNLMSASMARKSSSSTARVKLFSKIRRTHVKLLGLSSTAVSTKKGTMTEIDARKRSRRALKTQRGVAGQSWAEIQAKKNQNPALRKAEREKAINEAKRKKKESADKKKAASKAAKSSAKPAKQQFAKNVKSTKSGAGRVGGKR